MTTLPLDADLTEAALRHLGMSPAAPNAWELVEPVRGSSANHIPVLGRYTTSSTRPSPFRSCGTGMSPGAPQKVPNWPRTYQAPFEGR